MGEHLVRDAPVVRDGDAEDAQAKVDNKYLPEGIPRHAAIF
jgi:hypothetical protein